MSWTLWTPGWVVGSMVLAVTVVVCSPPLLRASRIRRRLAALASPQVSPQGPPDRRPLATVTSGQASTARPRVAGLAALAILAVLAVLAATVSPPLAVGVAAAGWVWPRWRTSASTRRHERAILAELPDVVDLLLVAVASGLNLRLSIEAVGERGPPLFGAALHRAATDITNGARVADAIEAALVPLGDPARPLSASLLASARYGTGLTAALDRLAIETRQLRRRQAEEAVRRVPVKLLFPLVLLVLPAFVLLTVVPLLASALRSLPL